MANAEAAGGRRHMFGAAVGVGRALRSFNLPGMIVIVIVIGIWELLIDSHVVKLSTLPSPSAISRASWPLIRSGVLPGDLLHTLNVTLIGWLIASVLGLVVGLVLGLSSKAWAFSRASFEVLRGIPGIALVMVAIVRFGLSTNMELAIVIYCAVWPVLVNTITGARGVTHTHSDIAALLRMTWYARTTKIVLPSAMPHVVVALRLGLATALALAVMAEMIGNPHGVGYHLVIEQQELHPAQMFTFVVAIGVLGLVLNSGFMMLLRRVAPGVNRFLHEGVDA